MDAAVFTAAGTHQLLDGGEAVLDRSVDGPLLLLLHAVLGGPAAAEDERRLG